MKLFLMIEKNEMRNTIYTIFIYEAFGLNLLQIYENIIPAVFFQLNKHCCKNKHKMKPGTTNQMKYTERTIWFLDT